jgi:hypothetical protein
MTFNKPLSMAAVALMSVAIAVPSFAQPYGPPPPDGPPPPPPPPGYYDNNPNYSAYRYYADSCGREKHNANVAGTILGGIAGALIGNGVSRGGGRAGGTVIGGVAGAVVGSNIARSTVHCDGPRPYWRYEQTVALDAYPGYPGRYENGWYWRHHCRWVQSERGWLRVCPAPNGYLYPEY